MYFINKNDYDCSGCTACINICSHNAITMEKNEEGFLYPVRHNDICINCGLCENICPFEHPVYKNDSPLVYAAYDKKERTGSSSGGIFYTIARYVINKGGIVYGAAYNDDLKVKHRSARTIKELEALRGSKYVQSDLNDCFRQIRDELKKGTLVYFTGVGCQVAGLYSFLRKKYDNLITSDIVCHGVPSQKMFDIHLQYLGQKHASKVQNYSFRETNIWLIRERVKFENGKISYEYDGNKSPYLYAFGLGYTYRYSCFKCPFAKLPRQGDISLADYWGVQKPFPLMDVTKGVSLVLVNSQIGKIIWNKIKPQLVYKFSKIEDATRNNPNVVRPTKEPPIRKDFFKILEKEGYEQMASTYLECPEKMRNHHIELVMKLRKWYIYQPYENIRRLTKLFLHKLNLK